MRKGALFLLLAMAFASSPLATTAQAQRARVFVASYGSDSNSCTFGSPCKTFQHAHDAVAAGGEITAIDSAGFGEVTITKSVTITSPNGVEAGIAAASGDAAITINAGLSDTVVLSGLTIGGAGSNVTGINFQRGAELEVVNCAVRNNTGGAGIFVSPSSGTTTVLISNTIVSDISADGDAIDLFANGGTLQAALDHVTVNNNSNGVVALALGGPVEVQIANSHIDNNIDNAIVLGGTSPYVSNVILKDVTINQTPNGISLQGNSNVWLSNVTQTAVSGFSSYYGIAFTEGTDNSAFSDGANHLMGSIAGVSLQSWPTN